MECSSCGRSNRAHARFCSGCGAPLTLSCASCGQDLLPDDRFCDGCGAAVGASVTSPATAPSAAARKTVTVLFCDLVGSTAFGEQVDAESSREVMARYRRMAQSTIEANGGTVAKFIGDGVMALWGADEVREDDAEQAVRAGIALQGAFTAIESHVRDRYGATVSLRVGVNTGEVVIDAADDDVVGDALNTAARLEGAATPGRVLVGASTHRATRHAIDYADEIEIRAKGKDAPVAAYEVVGGLSVDERLTPFVGRTEELGRLRSVLESSILGRRAQMVTVIGSPGVGKTRLAQELRAGVDGGVIAHELRCEPSGEATFAPVADLLRAVAGLTDSQTGDQIRSSIRSVVAELADADRVADLLAGFVGAVPMRSTEEMFFGVRRLLEVLGGSDPVVLVVDDIQWAQALFLDLLEHLAEWVTGVPLLIVALARPEIREVRSSFAEEGRGVAAIVSLEGLDEATTRELAARLLDADDLPSDVLERIPGSTEGNPLFVREVVRMLVDDGVLVSRDGRWELAIDLDGVEVPPTVTALLASRVDRLEPDERRVLELASVVGSEFPIGVLVDVQGATRTALVPVLERMRRKELVEPTGAYLGDDPLFRFHHVLIREAAYRRLLKGTRAELHQAVGEWIEAASERLVGDFDVTIGTHFEQARSYRLALDLVGPETAGLAQRAAEAFTSAANRALDQEDLEAAGSLASRALSVLADTDDGVPELLVLACEALLSVGRVADTQPLIDRLDSVAEGDARLTAWHTCFAAELVVLSDPGGVGEAERQAAAAADTLGALEDTRGVAKAHFVRAAALVRLGQVGACEAELDRALTAARSADDRRRVTSVLGAAPMAALWGPSPVPRAGGRCLDVIRLLRITTASPAVEATSVRCQGLLEALRGRFDTARSMLDQARETVVELGLGHAVSQVDLYRGIAELLADDPTAAEGHLREAYRGLGSLGIGADAGQAAAYLARALLAQGRLDEAEDLVLESDALAGQNPQTAIIGRSVHAEVLAARGDFDDALLIADEAVTLAAAGDILFDHANAVAALARVHALAGDADSAAEAATEAAALYEKKGATVEVGLGVGRLMDNGSTATQATVASSDPDAAPAGSSAEVLADRAYALLADDDFDAAMALTAPEIRFVDLRAVVGAESAVVGFRQMSRNIADPRMGLTVDVVDRLGDDVVAYRGQMATTGGRAAWEWVAIWHVVDGLAVEVVLVEPEDHEGLRREMERLAASSSARRSPAVEVMERQFAAVERDDADAAVGFWHPAAVFDDRLFVAGMESAEVGIATQVRRIAETSTSVRAEVLDHHGDELCLYRVSLAARSGRAEWEFVVVYRVVAGQIVQAVQFGATDEVAARAELDRLAASTWAQLGNSASVVVDQMIAAVDTGDVETAVAFWHPDGVFEDRMFVLGAESVDVGMIERTRLLAADESVSHRAELLDHRGDDLCLYRIVTAARSGRAEWEYLAIDRVVAGQIVHAILFDSSAEAEARAELDHLASLSPAAAVVDRSYRALAIGDGEAAAACNHPDIRYEDRRFMLGDESDDLGLRSYGERLVEPGISVGAELVESMGDHIVLYRVVMSAPSKGAEWTWLAVWRVEDDLAVDLVLFDVGDLDGARAAMNGLRGLTSAPAPVRPNQVADVASEVFTHLSRGDLDSAFGPMADDYTMSDNRLIPALDAKVSSRTDSMVFIAGLAPFEFEYDVVATRGDRHALLRADFAGQRDYSFSMLVVNVIDHDGKLSHSAAFDVDQLDEATEELNRLWCAGRSPVETVQAAVDAINANDYDAYAAMFHPDARIDDRRFIGGSEVSDSGWSEVAREMFRPTISSHFEMIDSDGDVVLYNFGFAGGGNEWRMIAVNHIVDGRGVEFVLVDDDLDEARAEFDRIRRAAAPSSGDAPGERVVFESQWVRLSRIADDQGDRFVMGTLDESGGVVGEEDIGEDLDRATEISRGWVRQSLTDDAQGRAYGVSIDFIEALENRDFERIESLLADDFVLRDGRTLGLGTLDRAAYLESVVAMLEMGRQNTFGDRVEISADGSVVHGTLLYLARSGDDWVEFARRHISVIRDGRLTSTEIFNFNDADGASRRFAELVAGSSVEGEQMPVDPSGEWVIYESRRVRLSRTTDDEGDRFILRALDDDGAVVYEEDVGEDLERAAELSRGWVRESLSDDAQGRASRVIDDFFEAYEHGDVERMASMLTDDFVLRDHRPLGLGTLEGAAYLETVAALLDLEERFSFGEMAEVSDDGTLAHGIQLLLVRSGPDWVEVAARYVSAIRDGQVAASEIFDFDDVEGASRRFAELVVGSSEERELGEAVLDPAVLDRTSNPASIERRT